MPLAAPQAPTRREAILEAALRCFTEHGVAGTTIDEVRRDSGASVGSIYHHFGSKEGIAAALYVEGMRRYQEGFLAALAEAAGPRAGIEAVVRRHLAWVTENPALARYLLTHRAPEVAMASDPALRELNREFFAAVKEWLAPHVRRGTVRDLPGDLLDAVLLGPVQEFARHWLAGRTRTAPARAERILSAAAWNALKAT
jgi:AcrR family transcriptional regulator